MKNPIKMKSQSSTKKFCERSESLEAGSDIPTKCVGMQISGGSYHKPINSSVNSDIGKPDNVSPMKFTPLFEKIEKFLEEKQSRKVNYAELFNQLSGSYLI